MTKPYKELLAKIKCWLGFHDWIETYEDHLYYSHLSPEHFTISVRFCCNCDKKENI